MPEPITPEQIEVCRLRIEAERSFGTASVVESDTLLAIIAVCQRLMADALSLSDKLQASNEANGQLRAEAERLSKVMGSAFDELVNDRPSAAEQTLREALFIPAAGEAVSG
jgi:hypothetical protein